MDPVSEKIDSILDIAAGLAWFLLVPFGILFLMTEFVLDLTVGAQEGIPAFFLTLLLRCVGTGAFLLLFVKGYDALTKSVRSKALWLVLLALCLCLVCLVCFFLWKNPAMDLFDGMQTERVDLGSIRFETDDDSSSVFYKIEGCDADGKLYIFHVNKKTLEKYRSLYKQNRSLILEVSYLRHTEIVMRIGTST